MSTWYLIIILISHGRNDSSSQQMIPFQNETACQTAMIQLQKRHANLRESGNENTIICVKDN